MARKPSLDSTSPLATSCFHRFPRVLVLQMTGALKRIAITLASSSRQSRPDEPLAGRLSDILSRDIKTQAL